MTKVGGGAFDLRSIDVGGSWVDQSIRNRWADHVDIISSAGTISVNLPSNDPTYHAVNSNFLSITSVLFRPTGNVYGGVSNFEFVLDNINVADASTVPEPATLTIWGLGTLGCAFAAYRRRQCAA
jgi:hypothetical protein